MNCKQVENIIFEKAPQNKESLPEEVQKHLEICENCNLYFTVMQKTGDFVAGRSQIDVGDDFYQAVLDKINTTETKLTIHSTNSFKYYRAVAASVLLLLAAGMGIIAGKYTANVYSDSMNSIKEQTSLYMGDIELADNSFDLINFDEK